MCLAIRFESASLSSKSFVGTLRGLPVMLLVSVAMGSRARAQLPKKTIRADLMSMQTPDEKAGLSQN